jgi:Stage II sporulation protein
MSRRTVMAAALAVAVSLGLALPGLPPQLAASSCSNWTSQTDPPPTIRVFRHATGVVETVDFRVYTKNVLSREWIGSWTTESLRSGALAVKSYAWYQVLHWRGGVNGTGDCFDVRDDIADQVYDPSKATWSTAAAAVDDTWATRVLKNNAIFPTYYNAGTSGEACGANANGWKMYQWGTQACGLAGKTAAEIVLIYYYPSVTVADAPAPSATATPTPAATPTATPAPTATPTPAATPTATPAPTAIATVTPKATASPTGTPKATAKPTASPTASPKPIPVSTPSSTPLPAPPVVQELPGGGQVVVADASAPPPPPPSNPEPAVATSGELMIGGVVHRSLVPWEFGTMAMRGVLEWSDEWVPGHAWPARDGDAMVASAPSVMSAATFRTLWAAGTQKLLVSLVTRLSRSDALALLLGAPRP